MNLGIKFYTTITNTHNAYAGIDFGMVSISWVATDGMWLRSSDAGACFKEEI